MKDFNYADWVTSTYQSCDDPTEWSGENRKCNLCDKEAENMDEYCENHQRCVMCGDNNDCICEEEFGNVSNCCEAKFHEPDYPDNDICSSCGEHAVSAWDEAKDNHYHRNKKVDVEAELDKEIKPLQDK